MGRTISRSLTGLAAAVATAAVCLAVPQAAAPAAAASAAASDTASLPARPGAAPTTWGPYHSPGAKRARALGTITATGENHADIPSAATLKVSGKVADLTRSAATCGWAVFGIATVNPAGNKVSWTRRHVRTCAYRTPKTFSFTYHRVYQVELKVCAEGRAAAPSIQCTAGNPAWKTIYVSPH